MTEQNYIDTIQTIENRIIKGDDDYFGYSHFHCSNMADYTLMSYTIKDMVNVYDITEEQAVEIISHLTHN